MHKLINVINIIIIYVCELNRLLFHLRKRDSNEEDDHVDRVP